MAETTVRDIGGLRLAARLALLPRFYSFTDVLETIFEGDVDAFTDAFCDGTLPPHVIAALQATMQPRTLEILLLRRIVRQLGTLLAQGSVVPQ